MSLQTRWSNNEIRVPRDADLVCVISWPTSKSYVNCYGCGWSMDRPSLEDIHDHVTDPGFHRIEERRSYYALLDSEGREHRENGPAVIPKGTVRPGVGEWYVHGKLHREDGPAVVTSLEMPEFNEWWFRGEQVMVNLPGDEYEDVRRALEDHEDANFLFAKLHALVMQSTLAGLVQGAAQERVD